MTEEVRDQEDLVTIGVTDEGNQVLERMIERGWFETDMAAFKAAVAFGLANCISPTESGRFQTKWNRGSLDQSGEFLEVVGLLYEGPRPWDHVRRVGDAALKVLAPRIERATVASELFGDLNAE